MVDVMLIVAGLLLGSLVGWLLTGWFLRRFED